MEEARWIDYSYDAFNQLVERTEFYYDGSNERTFFIYNDGQVALQFHDETLGSMAVGNLDADDLSNRYLWGPAVDQLFADEQIDWSDSDADGEVLWALSDHLGSVRDVVDSSGEHRLHRDFDAFGNILDESRYDANGAPVTPGWFGYTTMDFGFTGRPLDETTDVQNNLHRWYDGQTGRWMSEDPIRFEAGDANLNRYVGNSPIDRIDPVGLVGIHGGGSIDATCGILHGGFDISFAINFSTQSYPFFTFGIGITGGGGPGLGGGVSGGVTVGANSAVNVGQMEGTGFTAGVNTLGGGGGFYSGDGYGGCYISPGGGPIADIHMNDTQTLYLNTGPSNGPGKAPNWAWPWSGNASWSPGDTWDLWFGGG